eukprot:scaffold3146_cov98-Isochrysis_galbana.AAC.9
MPGCARGEGGAAGTAWPLGRCWTQAWWRGGKRRRDRLRVRRRWAWCVLCDFKCKTHPSPRSPAPAPPPNPSSESRRTGRCAGHAGAWRAGSGCRRPAGDARVAARGAGGADAAMAHHVDVRHRLVVELDHGGDELREQTALMLRRRP